MFCTASGRLVSVKENFADARRLYRYIWVLYSLFMAIFGTQQVVYYLFNIPSGALGELTSETLINGIALLIVGNSGVGLYMARRSDLDSGRGGTRNQIYASEFSICLH